MSKLFGIPVGSLAVVLAVVLVLVLGTVAALSLRNRVFLRLGIRNVRRRPGGSALIVAGSMLGTAIIAAALATGDTMSQTIRSSAIAALGRTDEVVAAKGADAAFTVDSTTGGATGATGTRYFPQRDVDRIAQAVRASGLVAGVAPVIVEDVAVQDVSARQNEPRLTLFASDARRLQAFGEIRAGGKAVSLAELRPGEIYLNAKAADTARRACREHDSDPRRPVGRDRPCAGDRLRRRRHRRCGAADAARARTAAAGQARKETEDGLVAVARP